MWWKASFLSHSLPSHSSSGTTSKLRRSKTYWSASCARCYSASPITTWLTKLGLICCTRAEQNRPMNGPDCTLNDQSDFDFVLCWLHTSLESERQNCKFADSTVRCECYKTRALRACNVHAFVEFPAINPRTLYQSWHLSAALSIRLKFHSHMYQIKLKPDVTVDLVILVTEISNFTERCSQRVQPTYAFMCECQKSAPPHYILSSTRNRSYS